MSGTAPPLNTQAAGVQSPSSSAPTTPSPSPSPSPSPTSATSSSASPAKDSTTWYAKAWPYVKGAMAFVVGLVTIAVGISALMTYRFQEGSLEATRRSETLAYWNARKDFQAQCLNLKDEAVPLDSYCNAALQPDWLGPPPTLSEIPGSIASKRDSNMQLRGAGHQKRPNRAGHAKWLSWLGTLVRDLLFLLSRLPSSNHVVESFLVIYMSYLEILDPFRHVRDVIDTKFGLRRGRTRQVLRTARTVAVIYLAFSWLVSEHRFGLLRASQAWVCFLPYLGLLRLYPDFYAYVYLGSLLLYGVVFLASAKYDYDAGVTVLDVISTLTAGDRDSRSIIGMTCFLAVFFALMVGFIQQKHQIFIAHDKIYGSWTGLSAIPLEIQNLPLREDDQLPK